MEVILFYSFAKSSRSFNLKVTSFYFMLSNCLVKRHMVTLHSWVIMSLDDFMFVLSTLPLSLVLPLSFAYVEILENACLLLCICGIILWHICSTLWICSYFYLNSTLAVYVSHINGNCSFG